MKSGNGTLRGYMLMLILAVFGFGLAACATDGRFEEAGEEIDEVVDDIDDAF